MRVISGTHGGRRLAAPPERTPARPMTDRVKEALFNRLMAADRLGGGYVLDAFAGPGGLGLEALSRGAEHCTFLEKHRPVARTLRENIGALGLEPSASVMQADALGGNVLHLLPRTPLRVIFCDPPYAETDTEAGMARIGRFIAEAAPWSEPGAWLILRSRAGSGIEPPAAEGWHGPESRRYKTTELHFYERPVSDEPQGDRDLGVTLSPAPSGAVGER